MSRQKMTRFAAHSRSTLSCEKSLHTQGSEITTTLTPPIFSRAYASTQRLATTSTSSGYSPIWQDWRRSGMPFLRTKGNFTESSYGEDASIIQTVPGEGGRSLLRVAAA